MLQGMLRISAVFFSRRPPVEPPSDPERKRPPIHPPERTPKPKPIKDPPVPPPPGKKPGDEPTPIGDPPGEADQPIRVQGERQGSMVQGVNGKEHSRHRLVVHLRKSASSTGMREKMERDLLVLPPDPKAIQEPMAAFTQTKPLSH